MKVMRDFICKHVNNDEYIKKQTLKISSFAIKM